MTSANLVSKRILSSRSRMALAGFAALALFGPGIDAAQAADVIRHTFAGASDGSNPQASLIQASDGNLYGTTSQGGSAGFGTVYELSRDTSGNFTMFTLLHTFTGGTTDGASPQTGSLLQASDGNLYGTTLVGGSSGLGTVYKLSKDTSGNFKEFTLLYSFSGSAGDGASPYAGLIQAIDGNLYGTTTAGGSINFGTVYELSKDSNGNFTVFTLLRPFTNSTSDGQIPFAGMIQASDGNLYGVTYGGGSASDGTAFELSKDSNGNFTVFTLLHSFTGCICATDGGRPQYAGLIQASDGNLYGTTDQGGISNFGVAFELSKDGSGNFTTFTVIHSFNLVSPFTTDGGFPYGGLIQASDGNLYGTTFYGGSSANLGMAYALSKDTNGNFTVLTIVDAFAGGADGANPYAGLLEASDGNLYGATIIGGQGFGVVYEIQTGFSFFSFTLSPSPNSVTLTPGGAAGASTITITPENFFTGTVTLSASGLPAGVTASFGPNPATSMSTLSLTAATGAATGTVTVTIDGTSGTLANSTAVSVTVNAAPSYKVGGTVSGLAPGNSVLLQDNSGDNLFVSANGSFTFATAIASGSEYNVTVYGQPVTPVAQTCVVTGGSGTVAGANVTSVQVICATNTYSIGGAISGLTGSGLVLQDNGGNNLPVSAGATTFTFTTAIASGSVYSVTVLTQPGPSQTCSVTSGSGAVGSANVTSVQVTCTTNTYTIGGTISGLTGSSNPAVAGLVLQDNGGNNLPVSAGATTFTFTTAIASGSGYSVTVLTQPTLPVAQTCVVTGGSGTVAGANVTNVHVACTTNTYTIGGTVTGLSGSGLVLQDNGGNNLPVSAGATTFTFTTAIASGSGYSVAVLKQPGPSQTCSVTSGSGTVVLGNVTSVQVICATNTYSIGGAVSGLAGSGLMLQDNGGNNLTVSADATTFTFTAAIASGSGYGVTVLTQPTSPAQTCVVTSGSGTVASANVTSVRVNCKTNTYSIGGAISGLAGSGLVLQDNGRNNLMVSAGATTFTFTTAIASGSGYSVTVLKHPTGPSQTCSVTSGSGMVASADVTSVQVICVTNTYSIGGAISGLTGSGLVLQDNGGNNLPVSADATTFTFTTAIASGSGYGVTVLTQPTSPAQTCVVTSGSGTVASANVTSVRVNCKTNTYSIGGAISGLAGSGLVLQDNGRNNLMVSAGATTFTFTTAIASGSGMVASADVTSVQVICATNTYSIGGAISGLTGSGLVLQDNGGNNLPVSADATTFTFTTAIASGSGYSVTVLTQPTSPGQTCSVTSGSGTVASANVTSVRVSCRTNI